MITKAQIDLILSFLPDKKINAIKEVRAATGIELKEAKDLVERLPVGTGDVRERLIFEFRTLNLVIEGDVPAPVFASSEAATAFSLQTQLTELTHVKEKLELELVAVRRELSEAQQKESNMATDLRASRIVAAELSESLRKLLLAPWQAPSNW